MHSEGNQHSPESSQTDIGGFKVPREYPFLNRTQHKLYAYRYLLMFLFVLMVIILCLKFLFSNTAGRSTANSKSPYCRWVFDHYEPSEYETLWQNNIKNWQSNACDKLMEPIHTDASRTIVQEIEALKSIDPNLKWDRIDTFQTESLRNKYKLMSRFHYKRQCYNEYAGFWESASGRGVQLIEPLWGYLRDPFDVYCTTIGKKPIRLDTWNGESFQSKEHIMPQGFAPYAYTLEDTDIPSNEWRLHGIPPWHSHINPVDNNELDIVYDQPRKIYLDLGSSYFQFWGNEQKGAGSGVWFYNTYHTRGQKFDRFVQVEIQLLDPVKVWDQVPDDLIGAYTIMNVPLEINKTSKYDVANLIKSLVRPHDFFALKVDIDSAPIEEPFIYSLLNNDSVAEYIDELMFEHHVDIDLMRTAWGEGLPHNMTDSYELFKGLRLKGIRAHSWP